MRTRLLARATLFGLLAVLTLTGCGDPRTSVYVENADAATYVVVFLGDRTIPVSVTLPGHGEGLVFDGAGDTPGRIELRSEDCAILATVRTKP